MDEAASWACVREKGLADRGGQPERSAGTLPVEVAQLLTSRVGLSEAEVAELTKDEAIAHLNLYWVTGA